MRNFSATRGFGMLGLVGFIALMAAIGAALTVSTLRSVRGSIAGINKLQVLAAAEGAAVLVATGEAATSSTVTVGDCTVAITPADDGGTSAVLLQTNLAVAGRAIYGRQFIARPMESSYIVEVLP